MSLLRRPRLRYHQGYYGSTRPPGSRHQDPLLLVRVERGRFPSRRGDHRQHDPPAERLRPRRRVGSAHRLNAGRHLPRADPLAPRGEPGFLAGRYVQLGRILRPGGRAAPELPPLDVRDVFRPRRTSPARTSTCSTARRRPSRSRNTAGGTRRPFTRPAASTSCCWASAATGTSASTSRSAADSRTRLATLDPVTRKDAASDFFHEDNVPSQALTMGIATIFEARQIMLLAFGEHKAKHHPRGGRRPGHRPRAGQLPPRTPQRLAVAGRGRRRRTDRRGHALGAG